MKTPEQEKTLCRRLRWDEIDAAHLQNLIRAARAEDTAGLGLKMAPARTGDPSTELTPGAQKNATAHLVARENCTICGLLLLPQILAEYGTGARVEAHVFDGAAVSTGTLIATLNGTAATLLTAERVLLNFLQKLTGIATLTAAYVARLNGTGVKLLDTRKTTPGWRILEKYAVATGGGFNHRLGLFDRIMLKDNHLAADDATLGERLATLVRKARAARPDLLVECEVDAPEQIPPVLDAGAEILLLDNFSPDALRDALKIIGDTAWTEASGGIALETISAFAKMGPDFISTGAITHHATWTDIGLDWK